MKETKNAKLNRKLIILAAIAAVILAVAIYCSLPSYKKTITVGKGGINNIEALAQLCTMDFYSEVPVADTINNKVMCAIQKQRGSVSFDLEGLAIDTVGDTVKIVLPAEIVEIHEATEDNSWQVIDSKGLGLFTSNELTLDEENALKSQIEKKSKQHLYHNGTIKRARAEAVENLRSLMEKVYLKPVKVTDPTPLGARYEEYK
ncbi:MAG: DUF4230 domain-containing protein [Duncaniella sp.]|nr:DUF4230 domain-containing protein [Duncaniella sp.]